MEINLPFWIRVYVAIGFIAYLGTWVLANIAAERHNKHHTNVVAMLCGIVWPITVVYLLANLMIGFFSACKGDKK